MQLIYPVFFSGGDWGSPIRQNVCQSPLIWHLSPFLDQDLFPPAEVRPRKFEKKLNIFLCQIWLLLSSKVPWKLYFILKIAKKKKKKKRSNFAIGGQFWLQFFFFFRKFPPPIRIHPRRSKILSPPHQKFREKKTLIP